MAAEKLRSRISRSDVACSLEIPFASETKWMAVRGRVVAGTGSLTKVYRPSGTGSTGHGDLGAGMGREADSQPVAGEAYFVKGTLENVLRQCATYVAGSDLAEAPLDEAARCVPGPPSVPCRCRVLVACLLLTKDDCGL